MVGLSDLSCPFLARRQLDFPEVIAFLTQTHRRYKRDRSMWDAERQQMQVNAAFFPLFFVADIILAFGVVEPHRCWSDLTPVAFPTTHTHAQFQARIAVLEGEKVGVEQLSTFFFFCVATNRSVFLFYFTDCPRRHHLTAWTGRKRSGTQTPWCCHGCSLWMDWAAEAKVGYGWR